MQTILGVGTVGTELAKALTTYTKNIRLVGRNPKKVNQNDELFQANLTNLEETLRAVEGSEIVYLTVGIPYSTKVWEKEWPLVMQNVITACKKHNAKLVFFDNVYMYGKVSGWMTEETPIKPSSKKGEVRARVAEMLLQEMRNGKLKALIARSADFYGPNTPTSVLSVMVFGNLKKRKKPQWMLNDGVKHTFTYVPDAVRAMALLGNTESAYNQVWHLPTDKNALTGKEIIKFATEAFGVESHHTLLSRGMLRMAGFFVEVVKENMEMLYQNEADYLFDSSKFENTFKFQVTPYKKGIMETVRSLK
ncbi:MAG: NAD-dependent epimerase/dehydratase [Parcubacteria group bacterium GW2011_GWA1_47_8]|nr:MAG: NAD-dependent epimerase/dehydratase [Parcubacteria group bacterium GW2011_GWA1_47_8]